jgi:hypothetical protein
MIAANNGHLLAFDNLSGLQPVGSRAGQFAVRRLYTDDEEVLFRAARPIVLNGIEDVIGRADLADRAIFLTLARPSQLDPEIANFWRREDENASPIKG